MTGGFPEFWLALALFLVILLAPVLDHPSSRLLVLFASDLTLRRTTAACAFGLLVTAYVFFRPPGSYRPVARIRKKSPPPPDVAGA